MSDQLSVNRVEQAVRRMGVHRFSTVSGGGPVVSETVSVAVEGPVTIEVQDVGAYTLMCSPSGTRALAVGFLLTEGLIESLDDIAVLADCQDAPDVVRVTLVRPSRAAMPGRNMAVLSSCGLCGSQGVDQLLETLPRVGDTVRMRPEVLRTTAAATHARQGIFARTGGTHAAAVFTASGEIRSFAEDIGRHNALDKAIGQCVLAGESPSGLAAAVSGRVSLEIAAKCARVGIELISAVSAPTSLAVQVAAAAGITLCAFVRGSRATVYTGMARIVTSETH